MVQSLDTTQKTDAESWFLREKAGEKGMGLMGGKGEDMSQNTTGAHWSFRKMSEAFRRNKRLWEGLVPWTRKDQAQNGKDPGPGATSDSQEEWGSPEVDTPRG